jgi:hypothetical protein
LSWREDAIATVALKFNQARRQLLKERQNITPLELTANNHVAIRIDAVNLKN